MKQGILLIAIYALILNQVQKNDKSEHLPKDKTQKAIPAHLRSTEHYEVAAYDYFDQAVYLVTIRESKRKMIVFEDGMTYEVFDASQTPVLRDNGNPAFTSVSRSSSSWIKRAVIRTAPGN